MKHSSRRREDIALHDTPYTRARNETGRYYRTIVQHRCIMLDLPRFTEKQVKLKIRLQIKRFPARSQPN